MARKSKAKAAQKAPDSSSYVKPKKKATSSDLEKLKDWKGAAVENSGDSKIELNVSEDTESQINDDSDTEVDDATESTADGAADGGNEKPESTDDSTDGESSDDSNDDSNDESNDDVSKNKAPEDEASNDESSNDEPDDESDNDDDFNSEFEETIDATDEDPFEKESDESDEDESSGPETPEDDEDSQDATVAEPPDDTEEFNPEDEDDSEKLNVEQHSMLKFACHRCQHLMPGLPEHIITKAEVMVKEASGKSRLHSVDIKVPYGKKLNCYTDPKCPARQIELVYCPITDEEIESAVDDFFMNDDTKPLQKLYEKADKLGEAQSDQVKSKAKEMLAQRQNAG